MSQRLSAITRTIGGLLPLFGLALLSTSTYAADRSTRTTSERARIVQVAHEWLPSLQSGDVERGLAIFTEDIIVAGTATNEVHVGKAAVRKMLTQLLSDYRPENCHLRVDGVRIRGNWAEVRARFRTVWQPKEESTQAKQESSHYIWLLNREANGAWKITRFLFFPNET